MEEGTTSSHFSSSRERFKAIPSPSKRKETRPWALSFVVHRWIPKAALPLCSMFLPKPYDALQPVDRSQITPFLANACTRKKKDLFGGSTRC